LRRTALRVYRAARLWRARRLPAPDWQGVRILGYHSIGHLPHTLAVRPDAFRAQMEAVAASGATPISLAAALELLDAGPVAGRHVCVTFDDGYRDNLTVAAPILRELGIPATVFVATGAVDGTAPFYWFDEPPPALSWDECRELASDPLFDVQPHTRTHPWLPQVSEERARDEIAGSRADLEARGFPATTFCYPGGLYGERERRLVQEAGYAAAVTTDQGVNTGAGDPHVLRRTLVFLEDGLADFALKLAGALDRPSRLSSLRYRLPPRARAADS
jgi:peptidoglycan/xylan/chitin deacetylase (PgdA/CDA1 family)